MIKKFFVYFLTSSFVLLSPPSSKNQSHGILIMEGSNILRKLTQAMVQTSQDVRHCAEGCMALGW
jgi:hypothetical protein